MKISILKNTKSKLDEQSYQVRPQQQAQVQMQQQQRPATNNVYDEIYNAIVQNFGQNAIPKFKEFVQKKIQQTSKFGKTGRAKGTEV